LSTNNNIKSSDYLSISQVAKIRGVTRQAISKLIKKGKIECVKIGGHILIHKDDLIKFKPGYPGRPRKK